jgi:hypothetical protein
MSRWFRMYDEILDDPKVQKLSPADFKGWVNLLCLASRNDGKLPPVADIAFALRETEDAVSTLLERLLNATLIECRSGGPNGSHYAPNKWNERQYKSDTSTGRVKRFRERSKPVAETPPDTETEADTEKNNNKPPKGGYAFEGKVIKLKRRDFEQWRKAFPDLDLAARLQSRDDWLALEATDKDRERWFMSTSNWLANQQQKAATEARQPVWDGMP